jgi:phage head maturation protease
MPCASVGVLSFSALEISYMDELIFFGGSVKALGDGKVGGYLVEFTDFEARKGTPPDVVREFFTKSTDYDIEETDKKTVYFNHGQDAVLKRRKLSKADLKVDDVGVWAETILDTRDKYLAKIYEMVEAGKLGWSSGSAPHLVERKKSADGFTEIVTWPIVEASLTHTPANPFSQAVPLKSFFAETEEKPDLKTVDGDALFNDSLRQTEQQTWELWSAVQTGVRKIVEAAQAKDVTGVEVNVREAVTALVGAYSPRLIEAIVTQVTDYLGSEVRDEHFYLKSLFDELNAEGGALAASKFSDHLQTVLAAAGEVQTRAKSIQELRVKSGRVLSEANRTKLSSLLESLQSVATDIESLLSMAEPKKSVDQSEVLALLASFEHTKMLMDTASLEN